jgi:hypothetical protein
VFTFGYDALEVGVIDRVILDLNRKPLLGRIERRPLRYGPGLEHPVHLEPEVVVQASGVVLLHDEQVQRL